MREQKRENGENIIFLFFLPVKIWEHGIYKQKKIC